MSALVLVLAFPLVLVLALVIVLALVLVLARPLWWDQSQSADWSATKWRPAPLLLHTRLCRPGSAREEDDKDDIADNQNDKDNVDNWDDNDDQRAPLQARFIEEEGDEDD